MSCEEIQEIIVLAKNNFGGIKGVEDTLVKADARVFKSKRTFGIIGTTSIFDDPDYDRVGLNFAVCQDKDESFALKVFEELMKMLDQCLLKSGFEKVEGGIPAKGFLQPITYFTKEITIDIVQRIPYRT